MLQETTIETAGENLASAIKSTPEWKRFAEAEREFQEDAAVAKMLEEYQSLAQSVQAAGQAGDDETQKLESLQVRIQSTPLFQKREEAAGAMLSLLEQANVAVSNNLGLNFAANAAPKQGCCGGGH